MSPPSNDRAVRCPCCGNSSRSRMIEKIPYREIWDSLREEWGFRISADVMRNNTPCDETTLFECGKCDLQFFEPATPGDMGFYRDLGEKPQFYSHWKWEFDWTMSRLPASAEVLDVGCGEGDFLAAVAPKVRRAVGTDWSPGAVLRARGRGLEVVGGDFAAHADAFEGAFTDVCAFHVLEHLPDPVQFLGSLRRCLRPGGSLFLSVPNRFRSGRAAFEPLDSPPHHLTRWSSRSLEHLAGMCDLRLLDLALEPVDLSVPRDRMRERIRTTASGVPLVGGFIGTWIPRLACRVAFLPPLLSLYRRLGVLERAGMCGMSVAVRFVDPSP